MSQRNQRQILKKHKPAQSGPERTCIGCRKCRSTADLVRFVHNASQLRLGRELPGRGAWLCADTAQECFETARKRKAVGRAFNADVTDAQLDDLKRALSGDQDRG